MAKSRHPDRLIVGWREWVSLPDLGIERIKVKVDTGARSSSLHAYDLQEFERGGERWVRFKVHPAQRNSAQVVQVIVTNIALLGFTWPVELTLANRDAMGFRMLLGRQAFRRRFLVDGGRSYYGGKPKRKKSKHRKTRRHHGAVGEVTEET